MYSLSLQRSRPHLSFRSLSQSYFLESLHESDDEFYDAVNLSDAFGEAEPDDSSQLHPPGAEGFKFQCSYDNSDDDTSQQPEDW